MIQHAVTINEYSALKNQEVGAEWLFNALYSLIVTAC